MKANDLKSDCDVSAIAMQSVATTQDSHSRTKKTRLPVFLSSYFEWEMQSAKNCLLHFSVNIHSQVNWRWTRKKEEAIKKTMQLAHEITQWLLLHNWENVQCSQLVFFCSTLHCDIWLGSLSLSVLFPFSSKNSALAILAWQWLEHISRSWCPVDVDTIMMIMLLASLTLLVGFVKITNNYAEGKNIIASRRSRKKKFAKTLMPCLVFPNTFV